MPVNYQQWPRVILTAISMLMVSSATAHERYILPSHTLLSGDQPQTVTVNASISNAIFHPDQPLGDSGSGRDVGEFKEYFANFDYAVIKPDGQMTTDTQWTAFSRMSVADVTLTDPGTYRIGIVQPDIFMTTFINSDGQPERIWGPSPNIPDGAKNVVRRTTAARVETFVTLNNATQAALKPTGTGIEALSITHPNDLFANEPAQFMLYFNGKPLTENVDVKLIQAGTRHRNDREEKQLIVAKDGAVNFTPTQAGFYLLIAETHIDKPQQQDVDVKHYSLYLTLEVFPE
ncbi:DUF4198 domain-containing protein [Shewanella sp.]|uniref:DUF4198 domain-containing protein n=1 Tax=Shewanella sp. TaxID=50422 RepID=UPI004047A533